MGKHSFLVHYASLATVTLEQKINIRRRHWPVKQVALVAGASNRLKKFPFSVRFNSLGNHIH